MEVVRRRSGSGCLSVVVAIMCAFVVVMVPGVLATRWTVGGNMGWTNNVNYTVWAQDKHFYNGDWLCKRSLSLSLSMCVCMHVLKLTDLLQKDKHFMFFHVLVRFSFKLQLK